MANRLWDPRQLPGRAKLVSFWDPSLHSTAAKDRKDRVTWASTTGGTLGTNTAPSFSGSAFGGPAHGFDFNGTDDSLDRAVPASILGNDVALSVVGALIADDVTSERPFWSISGGSTVPGVFLLGFLSGKLIASKRGETGGTQLLTSSATFSTGTVYQICFVHFGTTSDLYVNGAASGWTTANTQDAPSAITAPTKLMLGHCSRQGGTPDTYYDGKLGAFATFAGALVAREIAAQSQACMRRHGL